MGEIVPFPRSSQQQFLEKRRGMDTRHLVRENKRCSGADCSARRTRSLACPADKRLSGMPERSSMINCSSSFAFAVRRIAWRWRSVRRSRASDLRQSPAAVDFDHPSSGW